MEISESRVTAAGKVVFEGGGAFLRETRREVELYFSDARTRRSGILRLYVKAAIALVATVVRGRACSWRPTVPGGRRLLCRSGVRPDLHCAVRSARRESRGVLSEGGLQPSAGLDG